MKTIISIFLLLFSINSIKSQNFSVEPNLGINIMPMPKVGLGTDHKIAFNGGLNGRYEIFDNFTINLGLGLSDRRYTYAFSDTSSLLDSFRGALMLAGIDVDEIDSTLEANNLRLDKYDRTKGVANILYLEIPLTFTYQWKSIKFNAGGYIGFRVNYGKKEEVTSNVPLLQTVDVAAYDETGLLSFFLPQPYSVSTSEISNDENLDKFNFGLRLGIGYMYDSNLSFNASFNYDFNRYAMNNNSEITNNNYFIRLGMAYNIHSLNINKKKTKPSFN